MFIPEKLISPLNIYWDFSWQVRLHAPCVDSMFKGDKFELLSACAVLLMGTRGHGSSLGVLCTQERTKLPRVTGEGVCCWVQGQYLDSTFEGRRGVHALLPLLWWGALGLVIQKRERDSERPRSREPSMRGNSVLPLIFSLLLCEKCSNKCKFLFHIWNHSGCLPVWVVHPYGHSRVGLKQLLSTCKQRWAICNILQRSALLQV